MPDSERHRESHEDLCPSEKGVGLERWSLLREHTAFAEDLSSGYPETLACVSQLSVAPTPGDPTPLDPVDTCGPMHTPSQAQHLK